MSCIIREKWVWIIIGACVFVLVVPWMVIWALLSLPELLKPLFAFGIVVSWGIAAGYKDWLMDAEKRKPKSPVE